MSSKRLRGEKENMSREGKPPLLVERTHDLGQQLWLDYHGAEPDPARFVPIENRHGGWPKPDHKTGLWTSTLDAEGCWIEWCLTDAPDWLKETGQERGNCVQGAYVLHPTLDARVFTIDNYSDLERLVERFPADMSCWSSEQTVDWPAASAELDAVHLTDQGQWATRMSSPLTLYGWDCESTLWMRFAFERWEQVDLAETLGRQKAWLPTNGKVGEN